METQINFNKTITLCSTERKIPIFRQHLGSGTGFMILKGFQAISTLVSTLKSIKCPTIAVASPRVVELSIGAMFFSSIFQGIVIQTNPWIFRLLEKFLRYYIRKEFRNSSRVPQKQNHCTALENFFDPKIWIPSHGFKIFDRLLIWARTNTITQGQAPLCRKYTTSLPFLRKTSPKNLRPFFPWNILLFVYIHIHDTHHCNWRQKSLTLNAKDQFLARLINLAAIREGASAWHLSRVTHSHRRPAHLGNRAS